MELLDLVPGLPCLMFSQIPRTIGVKDTLQRHAVFMTDQREQQAHHRISIPNVMITCRRLSRTFHPEILHRGPLSTSCSSGFRQELEVLEESQCLEVVLLSASGAPAEYVCQPLQRLCVSQTFKLPVPSCKKCLDVLEVRRATLGSRAACRDISSKDRSPTDE